jgi:Protein of unknown function (DUF2934)
MATTKQSTEAKTTTKAAKPKVTKAATKSTPAKKTATPKKTSKAAKTAEISPSERYKMIEVAAYYIAEKNNFSGNAAEYWVMAEREISLKYPK